MNTRTPQRIAEDRAADLHYAYQFGQDSITAYAEKSAAEGLEIANEFRRKFGDDAEAQAEFDRGVEFEKRRHGLD